MKYLKLYESFSDDFYENLKKIESEYHEKRKKIREDFKSEIDDYMWDITDIWGIDSFIEEDDPVVWYELEFKHEDVQKVYDELKMANDRLKKVLGLQIRVEEIYRQLRGAFHYGYHGPKIYSQAPRTELMFIFNDEVLTAGGSGTKFDNPLLEEGFDVKKLKITVS
jgi:hypothetical protein